ncbi:hypothetical protein AW736_09055 [Termitidicoccus mucosus]|uniref:Uncharacterized protein n=1 Tax=Termitidicoccus mucosus TaxID=1184151 RepID=A0A178IFX9_9BACT|nr:hypothetical protein AW736_09055 [Opitutaceae bacterium TSB47]
MRLLCAQLYLRTRKAAEGAKVLSKYIAKEVINNAMEREKIRLLLAIGLVSRLIFQVHLKYSWELSLHV